MAIDVVVTFSDETIMKVRYPLNKVVKYYRRLKAEDTTGRVFKATPILPWILGMVFRDIAISPHSYPVMKVSIKEKA